MAHVAVTSLLRTIELEFFQSQPRPLPQDQKEIIIGSKDLINSLRDSLRFVQSFLEKLKGLDDEGRETLPRDLETKLRHIALRAEDDIESELSRIYLAEPIPIELVPAEEQQPPSSRLRQVLQRAVNEIDHIKENLVRFKDDNNNKGEDVAQTRKLVSVDDAVPKFHSPEHAPNESPEEIMVGKGDELTVMKNLLTEGSYERQVVSVHGMGGIGKTVLAKCIYEDISIKEHFDICAWVVISQHHNKEQMLFRLFKSILQGDPQDDSENTDVQIYRHLKGQRYLIVMDDVWSTKAWDDVKVCFPDDGNGSRVLLTTRLKIVAEYASTIDNRKNCHQMRFLNSEEGGNLFREKLPLMKESSNQEFGMIGKKVVEKCYGLPLAVVVAAGLFWNLKTVEEWKKVEKALDSLETKSIAERCLDILALSYNHLPHYLKSCFLYFGFFPKSNAFVVKSLVRFWIAEGFVTEKENESFEEVGEKHLHELSDRNLVLVDEGRSLYEKIGTCMIHDLLHDLSIREAQNENLLYVVPEPRGSTQMDIFPSDCRWITARKESYLDQNKNLYDCFDKCRSIIYFEEEKEAIELMKRNISKQTIGPRKHISNLIKASATLKLLRVLEISSFECTHELRDLCNWIAGLVHLRYLSFVSGFSITNLPLSKVRNLHALHISAGGITDPFPPFILDELPQLRYLKCWPSIEIFPPMFIHENLHSISWISPIQCTKQVFGNIPHIRKLSIKGERGHFLVFGKNLDLLRELESLSIDFGSFSSQQLDPTPRGFIADIASLQGLTKLKLKCTELLWRDVNLLARLPNLKVLKLLFQAGIGSKWKLEEWGVEYVFPRLKYLFICYSDLVEWDATYKNFPVLEHLILLRCFHLKEIPSGFEESPTLQSIELMECLPSVVDSAKQIEEVQHEHGNDTMIVVVHKRPSNRTSGPN